MSRKKAHVCQVCGATFASVTDHLVHVSIDHDLRRGGGTERTRALITCRSCGRGTHVDGAPCDGCRRPLAVG